MANYNQNLVKINRNYTFEEMAQVFGIHKNTVANWIKNGLPCLNERRPFLILGVDAREYLKAQRTSKKQKCMLYEMYCMRCKSPQRPAENMVDYEPINDSTGRLIGLCATCEGIINKYARLDDLKLIREELDIDLPRAQKHINKRDTPLLNSDFNK